MKTAEELGDVYRHDLKPTVSRFEAERKALVARHLSFFAIWGGLCATLAVLLGSPLGPPAGVASATIGFIALGFWMYRVVASFRLQFKKEVVARLVSEIDSGLTYTPEGSVDRDRVEESEFFKRRRIAKWQGEDLVSGELRGIDVQFSELHLSASGGGQNNSNSPIFRGLFLTAAFAEPFQGVTLVTPDLIGQIKRKMGDSMVGKMVLGMIDQLLPQPPGDPLETGDPDFDEKFMVYADTPEEALSLLNDDLRARLLAIHERVIPEYIKKHHGGQAPGMVYFSCRGTHAYIAVSSQRAMFEISIFKTLQASSTP
jgi:hypothetical protein